MVKVNWLRENQFNARPIVMVEDHVYHISELLQIIQSTGRLCIANLTVICLDRGGPDTDAAVTEWLEQYPDLQIACRITDSQCYMAHGHRLKNLSNDVFENQAEYCRQLAQMIRPGGLLIQDIELEPLAFVPNDRWWESTMLASTIRGMFNQRAPRCAFISNKRGYEATFGAELLAAGHDPRDVLDKGELEKVAVPFLLKFLAQNFPFELRWTPTSCDGSDSQFTLRVSNSEAEKRLIEAQLDIVLWPVADEMAELGGGSFSVPKKSKLALVAENNEYETWRLLIESRLQGGSGVDVQSVGKRVAPQGAMRAEITNAAARHIHSIRKRLANPQDILTVAGHYRLKDGLAVGSIAPV